MREGKKNHEDGNGWFNVMQQTEIACKHCCIMGAEMQPISQKPLHYIQQKAPSLPQFCNEIKIKEKYKIARKREREIKMAFNVWTFLISTPINDAIKIIHKITPQK